MNRGLLATAVMLAALASTEATYTPPQRARKRRPVVIPASPSQNAELAAWNAAVDAKKAAKRARKEGV